MLSSSGFDNVYQGRCEYIRAGGGQRSSVSRPGLRRVLRARRGAGERGPRAGPRGRALSAVAQRCALAVGPRRLPTTATGGIKNTPRKKK